MDGLTAIEQLRAEQPNVAVVILTTNNEDDLMRKGLLAGARGFILKDTDRRTLFDTIRAAARGETLLKPENISQLLVPADLPTQSPRECGSLEMTNREKDVLTWVAKGERNKELAFRLGITNRTVKAHLASIHNKLGMDSQTEAVSVAKQHGLLD